MHSKFTSTCTCNYVYGFLVWYFIDYDWSLNTVYHKNCPYFIIHVPVNLEYEFIITGHYEY